MTEASKLFALTLLSIMLYHVELLKYTEFFFLRLKRILRSLLLFSMFSIKVMIFMILFELQKNQS